MSTAIASIKFTGHDKGEMFVTFTSGVEVCYSDVPRPVAADFMASSSLGKFFNKNIRNNFEVR